MTRSHCSVLTALLVAALVPAPAVAQEGYRSLDAGRPIRASDAYPIKFLEWELQLGGHGTVAEARRAVGSVIALDVGILRNTELGIEFEPGWEHRRGRTESGLAGATLHVLHNVNQENWSLPGLSWSITAEAPTRGDIGRREWGAGGALIATRSFEGSTRAHVNVGYEVAAQADGGDHWSVALAFDRPIGLSGRLLAGDVFAEIPVDAGRSRVWAELGARVQLTNRSVLDAGIATRIDEWSDGQANLEFVLGISHTFGLRWLRPEPTYPDPAIR